MTIEQVLERAVIEWLPHTSTPASTLYAHAVEEIARGMYRGTFGAHVKRALQVSELDLPATQLWAQLQVTDTGAYDGSHEVQQPQAPTGV